MQVLVTSAAGFVSSSVARRLLELGHAGFRFIEADMSAVPVEALSGARLNLRQEGFQKGDVDRTEADLTRATSWLGYRPATDLRTGLGAELAWMEALLKGEG